ncbi:protein max isoform X2 [Eurytemora carolleeae]|uniref:protein max isoform X2 n=1 Tax=Eurytemora carolleeae TaxID=1294199 RepID=UPI000C777A74|nr:protein max isoform X2 [Eurytemora carolleeae]|eukprot:XP_023337771.1 protein max-like isoform X2 [Eurytemora affinis]
MVPELEIIFHIFRKFKMSDDDKDLDIESDEDNINGLDFSNGGVGEDDKRAHHNALERKRRDHIKDSFTGLKDSIPTLQGDKSSRAQILRKASEYIAFMRRKNASHTSDIEDLRRQNQHLDNQIRLIEKAKTTGQFGLLKDLQSEDQQEEQEDPSRKRLKV